MTILRSAIFMLWFLLVSVAVNVAALPVLLLPPRYTWQVARIWSALTLWGLRVLAGLSYEVRGTLPPPAVLVAAKHMSMWDTLALWLLLDSPKVVLKKQLLLVPFYGWYARHARMIAIDREGGASSLRRLLQQARDAIAEGKQILIFPEGTRRKPRAPPDYKPGVAGIYRELKVACAPVALNSGLFWTGPGGFIKKRGRIVVEFLPPIPPGLARAAFVSELETRIETATAALVAEGETQLASAH